MKIIIIEDEAAAYKNIKNLLLQIDPHIEILDHFDTVVDSVTWLRSHPMPDLIFMDIQMPGMDGLEAAQIVVERYRAAGHVRPPIIATTANAYEEDRRRALDAGMDGFAVKPIGKSEVCHLFATFVDAKIDE